MPPPTLTRVPQSVELLLEQLEAETGAMHRARRAAEAHDLARLRLEAALDALAPALRRHEAEAMRRRIRACRVEADRILRPRAAGAQTALMDLLAGWARPSITVAEVQNTLIAQGFSPKRTYAASALANLERQSVVRKTGRGAYAVNRTHADIVRRRLAALEDAMDWEAGAG